MGSPAKSSSLQTINMIKSVAILAICLFAAVSTEAEAEADAHYGAYGYGHHIGYSHGHLGHVYGHGLYGHGLGYGHLHHGYHYGKRSADAEPAADAYHGYGHGLAYGHYPVVSTIHGLSHHAYPHAYGHG